jgi:predicted PolB exonuclease-like 3'-5' exonuclease
VSTAIVFDLESVAIANADEFIEPATAPSNYKSEQAIADYIAKANAEQIAKAALDIDLARIVAIGFDDGTGPVVEVVKTEDDERQILTAFWLRYYIEYRTLRSYPTLIGFNCVGFDLPLLLRRSLYLGVKTPKLQLGKYRHPGIEDLMLLLSFDGALRYRSLSFYAKRFGLNVLHDQHTGADVPALVAAGDWEAVAAHCKNDVETTVALARRLGVL